MLTYGFTQNLVAVQYLKEIFFQCHGRAYCSYFIHFIWISTLTKNDTYHTVFFFGISISDFSEDIFDIFWVFWHTDSHMFLLIFNKWCWFHSWQVLCSGYLNFLVRNYHCVVICPQDTNKLVMSNFKINKKLVSSQCRIVLYFIFRCFGLLCWCGLQFPINVEDK